MSVAAREGHVDVVTVLLANNADPNQATTDKYGTTPLHVAAIAGHVDVATVLLANYADPNKALTNSGATPMLMAAQQGHVDVVRVLLANNADPNITTTEGAWTWRMDSVEDGNTPALRPHRRRRLAPGARRCVNPYIIRIYFRTCVSFILLFKSKRCEQSTRAHSSFVVVGPLIFEPCLRDQCDLFTSTGWVITLSKTV